MPASLALAEPGGRIGPETLAEIFPGAERAGALSGKPLAASVFRRGARVGFVFSTRDVVASVGFSGKPIDILVGITEYGIVTGAKVRSHNEPILVIGIPDQALRQFVAGYAGVDIRRPGELREGEKSGRLPDAISGATISSAVIGDSIIRAARAVARSRGLLQTETSNVRLDRESYEPADWPELRADGSIAHLLLSRGKIEQAYRDRVTIPGAEFDGNRSPDELYSELYAALVTPPRIGQNLVGSLAFNELLADMGPDDQAIFIGGNGIYSFKGTRYRRSGLFDRIQLVQGDKIIRLVKRHYHFVNGLKISGAPPLREMGVFVLPADTGFDPLTEWRLELLVSRKTRQGGLVHLDFPLPYILPPQYRLGQVVERPQPTGQMDRVVAYLEQQLNAGEPALWLRNWRERTGRVTILLGLLFILTGILVFQDNLVRHQRLYRPVRLIYLAITLVWLGWYAGAQLSVINVLTFAQSLLSGFRWEFFLLDPLIFILWCYVAITLLFWGRGVFCGWLCPFGALQELLNEAARFLRIPQITVPFALHERLWPIKHIIFLGLFAVSLHSTVMAIAGSEMEPFKTAISMHFIRHWPFVAYVGGLLFLGLFIERFFCRYLCPLGAALAIPARLRMFEWLKRRFQCGHDCKLCATRCTVQAIHPNGSINPNECIYCLACQANFFDNRVCPPLVAKRKRREMRARNSAPLQKKAGS
ncbi:MAG: regulatory protein NosR [Rhodospirillaceae bacterium]|nr:regulatory protein NosR [Rhodospirillaceae bacterium]MBT7288720.1 regulatory protein NosR [Rhodospirillaceae bacterium]